MMLKLKTSQGSWRILDNLVDVQWHATKSLPETSNTSFYTWKSETPENSSQGQKIYKLYRGNNFQAEFALYVYGQQYRTILKRNLIRDSDSLEQELAHLKAPVHHMSTRDLRGELVQQAKILCEEALSSYLERKGLLPSEDVPILLAKPEDTPWWLDWSLAKVDQQGQNKSGIRIQDTTYRHSNSEHWIEFQLREDTQDGSVCFTLFPGKFSDSLQLNDIGDVFDKLQPLCNRSYDLATFHGTDMSLEKKRDAILDVICKELEEMADGKSSSNDPETTDYDIQEITGAGNRYEITAKQGGRDLAILFDTEGYLLNDQGQTIESLR